MGKFRETVSRQVGVQGWRFESKWGVTANGYGRCFCNDENTLKAHNSEYTKNH